MATLRPKNQVTLPSVLLAKNGFRTGDALEFSDAPDGGITIRRRDASAARPNAFEFFSALVAAHSGLDQIDFEVPQFNDPVKVADL